MLKWLVLSIVLCTTQLVIAQNKYKVGDTLPVFQAETVDKTVFKFDSVLERPTIIVCWASWNEPSLQLLDEINQQYPFVNPTRRTVFYHNLDVVDFSIDQRPEIHRVTLKRENWYWATHLITNKSWESEVISTLRITKIPTVFIVDKHRKILVVDPDVKQMRSILAPFRAPFPLSN
jgi:hypothetical protein